jgi:hypothetical protein
MPLGNCSRRLLGTKLLDLEPELLELEVPRALLSPSLFSRARCVWLSHGSLPHNSYRPSGSIAEKTKIQALKEPPNVQHEVKVRQHPCRGHHLKRNETRWGYQEQPQAGILRQRGARRG